MIVAIVVNVVSVCVATVRLNVCMLYHCAVLAQVPVVVVTIVMINVCVARGRNHRSRCCSQVVGSSFADFSPRSASVVVVS